MTTQIWALPQFKRFAAGRTLSVLATSLIPTALTLTVIQATGSAGDLGIVLACELFPQLLLLPVGGVLADRLPPHRVAFAADVLRGLAQLLIGVELLLGVIDIVHLSVLSVVTGVAVAVGTPTTSPLVAAIVPQEARIRANSLLGVARGMALVIGPGLVALLVVTVGVGWSFVLTGLLFAVAAATLGGLRIAPRARQEKPATFLADLKEGWTMVRGTRWFWTNLIGHGVYNFTSGLFMTLAPVIAVRELGGEVAWVVIYQSGMAGMVAGAFLAARLRIRRPLVWTSISGAAFLLPQITFAIVAPAALNVAAYFIAMLGLGILNALWMTVMQQEFESHTLARADSYDALLSFAARPLGHSLAAPAALLLGEGTVLAGAAILVGVVNLGLLALPEVRGMTTVQGRADAASQEQAEAPEA